MRPRRITDGTVFGGFALALLGTTCCALPAALVALGLGGVVASLVAALPGLVWLSQYKAVTFAVTALVLIYGAWRLKRTGEADRCSIEDRRRLKWQKRLLAVSIVLFAIAVLAAYALLPITRWLAA